MTYEIFDSWWTDAGTYGSFLHANNLVAEIGANKITKEEATAPTLGKEVVR